MSTFRLLTACCVAITSVGLSGPAGYARGGNVYFAPLLDNATCTSHNSGGRTALFDRDENVPIGRELHSSDFHLRARRSTTSVLICQIDPSRFKTLVLRMGVSDADAAFSPVMKVTVFQSGNSRDHIYDDIMPGRVISVALDAQDPELSRPEDIAIEFTCEKSSGRSTSTNTCFLHFIEAELTSTSDYRLETRLPDDDDDKEQPGSTSTSSVIQTIEDLTNLGRTVEEFVDLF